MPTQEPTPRPALPLADAVAGLWLVLLAGLVVLGADLMWAVGLGDAILAGGTAHDALANLAAPHVDWPNPLVLAEVLLSWAHGGGGVGLAALHLAVVGLTLLVLVRDGRAAGAGQGRLAVAVSLAVVGGSATLAVVRLPTLSLLPFAVLVALLRRHDRGSRRAIWWVPPLMVLWGNLHGAVLVGVAVLGVFVVAGGRRGLLARVVAGLAGLLSLVLTSAGLRTPEYYVAALSNEAAVRGSDLWARLDLGDPLDVALLAAAAALLAMAARSLRPWEWLVVVGLALGTASAARHGVWLLLFLVPVAAITRGRDEAGPAETRRPRRAAVAGVVVVTAVLAGAQLLRRADALRPPGSDVVAVLAEIAGGRTVLAVEPEAETFAQRGVQVWVANPVDAFERPVQAAFLDFLHDCRLQPAAADEVGVLAVRPECAPFFLARGWREHHRSGRLVILGR